MEHYRHKNAAGHCGSAKRSNSIESWRTTSFAERMFSCLRTCCSKLFVSACVRRLVADQAGVTIIVFSLALPILLAVMGGAIDYGFLFMQKSRLQSTADASAVAAAREYHMANTADSSVKSTVEGVVSAHLGKDASAVKISVTTSQEPLSVTVDLQQAVDGFVLSQFKGGTVGAHAVALVSGGTPLCVLGLDESADYTISLDSSARLKGQKCAVYSNSRSSQGVASQSNARLHAELICSAGGITGGETNFEPNPLSDCPPMIDPLAARPAPPIGSCKETNLEIIDKSVRLSPGVYCGGLRIDGNARVYFLPGIYVIKDGPFNVDSNSEIQGRNVGFYLTGTNAVFRFASNASVDLEAPKDGPMAGLLFFEAHGSPKLRRHEILSNFAHVLVGTVYLPEGRLVVDADNDVADRSAYTAIIARQIELYAGPNLVLNTDYDQTEVPVPAGIAQNRKITLIE